MEPEIKVALEHNRPYAVFPPNKFDELRNKYGDAVFKYSSNGKEYTIVNLFKLSFSAISTGANGIEYLPVSLNLYRPKPVSYIVQGNELEVLHEILKSGNNALIYGPKGVGKTLMVHYYAYKHEIPIYTLDCSEDMRRFDLIGRFTKIGDSIKFILGAIPKAIELANQAADQGKPLIFLLEEINTLTPAAQKILNPLLDWRRKIEAEEINKVFELRDDARLYIVATMNPSYYSGVYGLNEDLKSRFLEIFMGYPPEDVEKAIIVSQTGIEEDNIYLNGLIRLAAETRGAYERLELSYCLSPRDLVSLVKFYISYRQSQRGSGKRERTIFAEVLKTVLLSRFDKEDERKFIKSRVDAIFDILL